jgi:signal transduction histidine kinase/CheY-like chemotaxis protein
VVDDNGVFASHLVQTLQRLGYEAEHRGDVQEILSIASHANPSTVFLIDAIMQPVDGVSLITDICEHGKDASTPPKCILMSALSWDEQSSSLGRKSLSLLTKDLTGRFIFWDKGEPDVDKAIAEIDELILGYDSFVSRVECPRMRGDPTARPTQEGSSTDAFANSTSLSDIVGEAKRQVGATWGALFEMDRNAWRVRIIAGDEPLRTRATEIGAQNYLPNSPIRDLSYQPSSILVEMRVGDHIPRFRNLLRFFGGQRSIHDAVDEPYFVSLVAIRLNIRTSKKYTFFLFFKDTPKLQHKQMVKDLESAALKAELAILHQIHEYHVERDQPFYLEGLARAGLRHDARGSLSDIRFAVRNAMDAIDRNQLGRAKTNLREIDAAAKETHQWIDESLARFHFEARMEYFDVRQVVKRGADIARAVGENSGIGRTVNIRTGGFGDSPSLIFGDAYALQRLVENLLVNAVEHGQLFIRRSVDILIECQRCEDESFPTAILIHDNGPGIHGVDLEHIFEPLFSTKENGYGMGLAVVSSIARDYGIEVEVYSTVVLVGTTFIIRLPKSMRRTHQEDRI